MIFDIQRITKSTSRNVDVLVDHINRSMPHNVLICTMNLPVLTGEAW
jgi:hypothetical protein